MIDIAADSLRVGHMAAFALGIGAAAFLEMQLLRRFQSTIDIEGLRLLLAGHDLIRTSVLALWVTGLGLLCLNIVVLGNDFTAKLGIKLGVVILLTGNMVLIERFLIPELFEFEGRGLADIPAGLRCQFGAVAGVSAGCWGAALLLGGVHRFREMAALEVLGVIGPLLIVATIAGAAAALAIGRHRPWPQAATIPGE